MVKFNYHQNQQNKKQDIIHFVIIVLIHSLKQQKLCVNTYALSKKVQT